MDVVSSVCIYTEKREHREETRKIERREEGKKARKEMGALLFGKRGKKLPRDL